MRAGPLPLPAWVIQMLATPFHRRHNRSSRGPAVREGICFEGLPCIFCLALVPETPFHRYRNLSRRGPTVREGICFQEFLRFHLLAWVLETPLHKYHNLTDGDRL